MGSRDRRDAWLELAREASAEDPAPALITVAEMSIKDGNTDAALEALSALEQLGELNPRGLLLLARVYRLLAKRFYLEAWMESIQRKLEVAEGIYQVVSDQGSSSGSNSSRLSWCC